MAIGKFVALMALAAGLVYLGFCVMLYVTQRSHLYFPTSDRSPLPTLVLRNDNVEILVSTQVGDSDKAVLYFGGNAEEVSYSIPQLAEAFAGHSIYAMHYRGYSGSGGSPSETALVADAKILFDLVRGKHREIVVVGRSLGSGVAIQLAVDRDVHRLLLVTPFHSIAALAAEYYPLFPVDLILHDRWDSWRHAPAVDVPTTIIVAGRDRIIPPASAHRLAEAFTSERVRVITLAMADHNDIADDPGYLEALRQNE